MLIPNFGRWTLVKKFGRYCVKNKTRPTGLRLTWIKHENRFKQFKFIFKKNYAFVVEI
jgi:hypothetical protein